MLCDTDEQGTVRWWPRVGVARIISLRQHVWPVTYQQLVTKQSRLCHFLLLAVQARYLDGQGTRLI